MAVLTNEDFTAYKHAIRRDPDALAEMKALSPSKTAWKAALQALEDGYNSRRLAIKSEMEAASGLTLSNALAKVLEDVWMARKAGLI